jgi:hypothetical protein
MTASLALANPPTRTQPESGAESGRGVRVQRMVR